MAILHYAHAPPYNTMFSHAWKEWNALYEMGVRDTELGGSKCVQIKRSLFEQYQMVTLCRQVQVSVCVLMFSGDTYKSQKAFYSTIQSQYSYSVV